MSVDERAKEAELPKPLEVQKTMNEVQMSDTELRHLGLYCWALDLLKYDCFYTLVLPF